MSSAIGAGSAANTAAAGDDGRGASGRSETSRDSASPRRASVGTAFTGRTHRMKIGFIGLGIMGRPMALNLHNASTR